MKATEQLVVRGANPGTLSLPDIPEEIVSDMLRFASSETTDWALRMAHYAKASSRVGDPALVRLEFSFCEVEIKCLIDPGAAAPDADAVLDGILSGLLSDPACDTPEVMGKPAQVPTSSQGSVERIAVNLDSYYEID